MRIRYVPADPAGNLTALVLTPVEPALRAQIAARLMHAARMEQAAFVDETSLSGPLPRMDMMGGEFCGNATRAFGLYAATRRGLGERELSVSVSGAKETVRVTMDPARGRALADMPLPVALKTVFVAGRDIPVVRMEGIAHAVLLDTPPSPQLARDVLRAMPGEDAQGVLFVESARTEPPVRTEPPTRMGPPVRMGPPTRMGPPMRMTPLVFVSATGTCVWESSCGSGSVALAWLLSRGLPDGDHAFSFEEPGGAIEVTVRMRAGRSASATMGGRVALGEEREIEL